MEQDLEFNEKMRSIKEYCENSSNKISDYINSNISTREYDKIPGENHSDKVKYPIYNDFLDTFNLVIEKKKKVNILIANDEDASLEIKWLSKMFDINVIKHKDRKKTKIDLVLFTGGEDVDPSLYDEEKGKFTSINKNRDLLEKNIFNEYYYIPKLGICRGAQFLTVMSGGKLVQHVSNHGQTHPIKIKGYNTCNITSTHHQMMYPFELNQENYELIAHSLMFRSITYLNGKDKEIEKPLNFLESEIVYYHNSKSLAIQGHPEYENCDEDTKDVCLSLIKEKLIKN